MGKFVRTDKGYINSEYIIRVEIPEAQRALIHFRSAGSEATAEIKGEEEVRELKTILELPVPREEGYTGSSMHEYPESTGKRR